MSKKSNIKTYAIDATITVRFTHIGEIGLKGRNRIAEEVQIAVDKAVADALHANDCLESDPQSAFDVEVTGLN